MKRLLLFALLNLLAGLAHAVNQSGTGTPQPGENGPQALPALMQWLLSYWPF